MVTKNNNGWTLVELMMVVAIVGLVVTIAPTVIIQSTKFFILSKTKIELQQQARGIMYIITRELRQAQSNTLVISQVVGQPYYSRISFTKVGGSQQITYYQSGSKLMMTNNNDTTTLTKNLAYLSFTFPSSDDMTILSVSMTLQEQIYQGAFKALHMASERVRVMN